MAAPKKNRQNQNGNNNNNTGWNWLYKLGGVAAVGVTAYYFYRRNNQNTTDQESDNNDPQSITPKGGYKKLNLVGIDDDASQTASFYGPTPRNSDGDAVGDGTSNNQYDARQEYISTLLQQRRFSSVLCNQHLYHSKTEHYFHLGFDSSSPLLSQFNRTKWVIIVRSKSDVKLVATRILNEFPQFIEEKNGNNLPKPIGSTDRFYMLKIASIVIVSCGIGASSLSILLQEITKLLVDAGAFAPNEENESSHFNTSYVEYILLISAPGIAVSPSAFMMKTIKRRRSLDNIYDGRSRTPTSTDNKFSFSPSPPPNKTNTSSLKSSYKSIRVDFKKQFQSKSSSTSILDNDDEKRPSQITNGEIPVIIPTSCYNEQLINYRQFVACGAVVQNRSMKFDRNLISDIKIRCSFLRSLKPKMGKGLSVQYFNEALSHNSVAIQQDKNIKTKFIQSCIDQGIKYVDMESGYFAAFCHKLHISSVAIVGIEYDIAAPSSSNNNMRVSHSNALQATLDIFCQYLWDRISQDNNNNNNRNNMQRAQSNSYIPQTHNLMDNDEDDSISQQISSSVPLDRSQSFPIMQDSKKRKKPQSIDDIAASPANGPAYSKLPKEQNEGS